MSRLKKILIVLIVTISCCLGIYGQIDAASCQYHQEHNSTCGYKDDESSCHHICSYCDDTFERKGELNLHHNQNKTTLNIKSEIKGQKEEDQIYFYIKFDQSLMGKLDLESTNNQYQVLTTQQTLINLQPIYLSDDTKNVYLKYSQDCSTKQEFNLIFKDEDLLVMKASFELTSASSFNELDQREIAKSQIINEDTLNEIMAVQEKDELNDNTVVNPTTQTKDLTPYVTDVNIEHTTSVDDTTHYYPTGGIISKEENVKFDMSYTLPSNTLNTQCNTVVFKAPGLTGCIEDSGYVTYNGQQVGIYKIASDGTLTITYTDEYVMFNEDNENPIKGKISYVCQASQIITNDQGETTIKINDEVSIDLKVNETGIESSDLQVLKKATSVNEKTGIIDYQLTITSENGTNDKVILDDYINNAQLNGNGNIKVYDSTGHEVAFTNNSQENTNQIHLVLPKMEKGDVYTVTYQSKTNLLNVNGDTQVSNTVTVQSKDQSNKIIKDSSNLTSTLHHKILSKNSEVKDGYINWTIVVNEDETDISGLTLKDTLSNEEYKKTVNVDPPINGKSTITLPYTFPKGTNKKYTITYQTPIEYDRTQNDCIVNKATLEKEGVTDVSVEKWQWVGSKPNPISKYGYSLKVNENQTATIKWSVQIQKNDAWSNKVSVFKEDLGEGQWFTDKQVEDAVKSLIDNFNNMYGYSPTLTNQDYTLNKKLNTQGQCVGFTITLHKAIELKYSIAIDVASTTSIPGSDMAYENKAYVNDFSTNSIYYYTTKPVVKKYDLTNYQTNTTSHKYYDDVLNKNGTLRWGVEISVPIVAQTDDVVITENLPKGVSLLSGGLKIQFDGLSNYQTCQLEEGKDFIFEVQEQKVTVHQVGQTVKITIPKDLMMKIQGKIIRLEVNTKINDDFNWSKNENDDYQNTFKNEVVVSTKESTLGTGYQSQTIIKDESVGSMIKNYQLGNNNTLTYTLTVNQYEKDLDPNSDRITIIDQMSYQYNLWYYYNAVLKPETVKVYYRNSDGTKGNELSKDMYELTYQEDLKDDKKLKTQVFKVPDQKGLIIEYDYVVNVSQDMWVHLNNQAYIECLKKHEGANSQTTVNTQYTESNATAYVDGIRIYKTDSTNASLALHGAKFKLYKWNSSTNQYEVIKDDHGNEIIYMTNKEGYLALSNLQYNVAYRLKEIEAPDGYELSQKNNDFVLTEKELWKHEKQIPDDFNGAYITLGEIIYVTNDRDKNSVTITKQWKDSNGQNMTVNDGKIDFELYQKRTVNNKELEDKKYSDYQCSGPQWTTIIEDLPSSGYETIDGQKVKVDYTYYVKEKKVESYKTTYVNNDGITTGNIQIVNTSQVNLPKTGGKGIKYYFLTGVGLIILSIIYYLKRVKNKDDKK